MPSLVVVISLIIFIFISTNVHALGEPALLWKHDTQREIKKLSFIPDESSNLVVTVGGTGYIYVFGLDGNIIKQDSTSSPDFSTFSDGFVVLEGKLPLSLGFYDGTGNFRKSVRISYNLNLFFISSDGRIISSIQIYDSNSIIMLDEFGNKLWRIFPKDVNKIYDMGASEDVNIFCIAASTSIQRKINCFNNTGELIWDFVQPKLIPVTAVTVSSDGERIFAGTYNSLLYSFDKNGDMVFEKEIGLGKIKSVSTSFDGRYIALGTQRGGQEGHVLFINYDGALLWDYEADDFVNSVSVSSDGRYTAAGTKSGKIYLFDNKEHIPLAEEAVVTPEENQTAIEETPLVPTIADITSNQGIYSQTENISISGIITQVLNAGESTFVEIDDGTGKIWIVTPEKNVIVGEEVTSEGILMFDFLSETLGKTFGTVLFPETSFRAPDLTTAPPTTTPVPMPSPTVTTPTTPPPTTQPPTTPVSEGFVIGKPVMYGAGIAILLAFVASTILSVRSRRAPRKATGEIKPALTKTEAMPERGSEPAISVTGLSKSYKNAKILDGVDFQLERGKLCAVVGPSGGGKSTIIESITGRITPDEGKIQIMGLDARKKKEEINKLVGFVPQHPELYMDQSVWRNMMNSALKWEVKDAETKSEKILKQLGIFERKDVVAKNLSGGQLKRLSLGMELIREPPILILDEPTTGLDPTSRDQILSALSKIVFTDKKTAILTTHFMDEAEHCDEVIIVGNAKIIAKGAPSELARRMPGMGKIVRVSLDEIGEDLVSKVEGVEGVKKVIREGRVMKIIMDSPDPVEISQKIKGFGGIIEGSKVDKARMKEVFVYYTGVYPEE